MAVQFVRGEAEYRAVLRPGQVISYVVQAAPGDRLHADLISENSDILLEMHKDGTELFGADQGSVLMRELAEAGDYIVTLRGASEEVESAFRLYLSLDPAPGTEPVPGAVALADGAGEDAAGAVAAGTLPGAETAGAPAGAGVTDPSVPSGSEAAAALPGAETPGAEAVGAAAVAGPALTGAGSAETVPVVAFAGETLIVPVLPQPDASPSGGVLGDAAEPEQSASDDAPAGAAGNAAADAGEAPAGTAEAAPGDGQQTVGAGETTVPAVAEAGGTVASPPAGDSGVPAAVPEPQDAATTGPASGNSDAAADNSSAPAPGAAADTETVQENAPAAATEPAAEAVAVDPAAGATDSPAAGPGVGPVAAPAEAPASQASAAGAAAPTLYYLAANLDGAMLNLRRGPSRSEPVVSQAGEGRLLSGSLCQPGDGMTWCRVTAVDDPSIWGWAAAQFLAQTAAPQPEGASP